MFDRIHNGVVSKIEEKGGLAAKLFHWGFRIKSAKLKRNIRNDKVPPHGQKCIAYLSPAGGSLCGWRMADTILT